MKVDELKKDVGRTFKVRPLMRRIDPLRGEQPARDDLFKLERCEGGFAYLQHVPTGRVVKLGNDNIREYRTPEHLMLRCELIDHPAYGIRIEPFVGNTAPLRPPTGEGHLTGRRIYVAPEPDHGQGDARKTGEIVGVEAQPNAADPRSSVSSGFASTLRLRRSRTTFLATCDSSTTVPPCQSDLIRSPTGEGISRT